MSLKVRAVLVVVIGLVLGLSLSVGGGLIGALALLLLPGPVAAQEPAQPAGVAPEVNPQMVVVNGDPVYASEISIILQNRSLMIFCTQRNSTRFVRFQTG